jgi:hypothetical protein
MTDAASAPITAQSAMRSPRTVILARSKMTVVFDDDFSTADVIAAQRASGKETGLFSLYLAQRIATFDGAHLTMGDIREKVRGRDYLQLTAAILGGESEDDEGN